MINLGVRVLEEKYFMQSTACRLAGVGAESPIRTEEEKAYLGDEHAQSWSGRSPNFTFRPVIKKSGALNVKFKGEFDF